MTCYSWKYLTILRIKNFKLVNAFLLPKSSHFSLLVGYNIQPSSSSTNQNAALIIDHQLDFTKYCYTLILIVPSILQVHDFFTLLIYLLFFSASQSVEDTVGSVRHKNCPVSLHPCARDAYLLFQVNHFEDQWMISHWFVSFFRSGRLKPDFSSP